MRVLVVDDEEYTREGIVAAVDWEILDINEVMQARDGREAFEISEWFEPDIVLTDIRMPLMDGIEFVEQLLENLPSCKILFITGFMEIEYLKKAIQLSAIDFIEKPISIQALQDALKKAVVEAKKSYKLKKIEDERKDTQISKLIHLIRYKNASEGKVFQVCQEIGFPLTGKYVCLMWKITEIFADDMDKEQFVKRFERILNRYNVCTVTDEIEDGQFVTVAAYSIHEKIDIFQVLEKSQHVASGEYKIGIGIEVTSLNGISESYRTASLALGKAFYRTEEYLFVIDENIMTHPKFNNYTYSELCKSLIEKKEDILIKLEQFFSELVKFEYVNKEQVLILIASLINDMIDDDPVLKKQCWEMCGEKEVEEYLNTFQNFEQVKEFMVDIVFRYLRGIQLSSQYSTVIQECMKYISAHCAEVDLNLQQVADHAGLSTNYFSLIFKRETGYTVRQYIEESRIELSKKYLKNHSLKITDISRMSGFSSAGYFSKVFKNITGMTPAVYRSEK